MRSEKSPVAEVTLPQWYLVQARPRQAELAVEHLERQGYCVFHPRLHVEQLRRGRPVVVEQALFPDYLFIRLQAGVDNFGPVRSTRGARQIRSNPRPPNGGRERWSSWSCRDNRTPGGPCGRV